MKDELTDQMATIDAIPDGQWHPMGGRMSIDILTGRAGLHLKLQRQVEVVASFRRRTTN